MDMGTRTKGARALLVAMTVALLQVGAVASPSWACACGAIEQLDDATRITIDGETALVRHDGETEEILMSFDMRSDSESAALILPLPAQAELDLGDADAFDTLLDRTKPEVVTKKRLRGLGLPDLGKGDPAGGAAPTGSNVRVLDEQELGPFTTTQLTSDDSEDLRTWLEDNDYRVRDEIVGATQPYLDEGWVLAVFQLEPGSEGLGFDGDLQPVRASFPSEEMVYPMRLQAEASREMPLRVYTLTEHRTVAHLGGLEPTLKFAGKVEPDGFPAGSTLRDLVEGTPYLTRHDMIVAPEDAATDMTFSDHGDDAPFREETVVWEDYPWVARMFVPSWGTALAWAALSPFALGAGVLAWLLVRTARRPRT